MAKVWFEHSTIFLTADIGWKAKLSCPSSTANYAHRSPQTYMACGMVWFRTLRVNHSVDSLLCQSYIDISVGVNNMPSVMFSCVCGCLELRTRGITNPLVLSLLLLRKLYAVCDCSSDPADGSI